MGRHAGERPDGRSSIGARLARIAGGSQPDARGDGERRPGDRATTTTAGVTAPARGSGLAIAAIVRDEAPYIEEWLAWHLALGAEHAFIHDNDSRDDLRGVLRPYVAHGLVTLIDRPGPARQLDAWSDAIELAAARFAWLALIDADELIVPHRDPDLPALLARLGDADQVLRPMRDFGYSGHRAPPGDLSFVAYTTAHERMPRYGDETRDRMKAIVRPEAVTAVRVHGCRTRDGKTVDAAGRRIPESYRPALGTPGLFDVAQVNHYATRSFAEYARKQDRGSATGRPRRPDVPFDLPGTEDRSALRHETRVRERLAALRRLAPDPYRGATLRPSRIARPDPFHADAERALANHVAGLAAPTGRPAFAIPAGDPDGAVVVTRVGPGTAVAARDAAVAGAVDPAAPGALGRSVHLAALIERMGASVTYDLTAAAEPPDDDGERRGIGDVDRRAVDEGVRTVPAGDPAADGCPVVAFTVTVDGPAAIRLTAGEASVEVALDRAGTWLGIAEVTRVPQPGGPLRIQAPASARWGDLVVAVHP